MSNKQLRFLEQIISIPIWLLIFTIPSIMTHRDMVRTDFKVMRLKRATARELKQKMESVEWGFDPNWPYSLFDAHDHFANYFHASVFRFGEVGYLMTPFGLLMANIYQRRLRKKLPGYQKGLKPYVTD